MSSWESVWFTDHTEQNWKKCLKYSFSYSLTMTISWKIYHGGKFFLWSWGIYTSRARTSRILPCSSNKRWKHLTKFKTCSGQSQDLDSMKSFAIWMELYPPHWHKSLPHRHTGRRNGMTGTLWSPINANAKSWTWYKISPCAGTGDWLAGWVNTLQESAACPCSNEKELRADISTCAAGRSREQIIPLYLAPVKPNLQHWHSVWGPPVQERH